MTTVVDGASEMEDRPTSAAAEVDGEREEAAAAASRTYPLEVTYCGGMRSPEKGLSWRKICRPTDQKGRTSCEIYFLFLCSSPSLFVQVP